MRRRRFSTFVLGAVSCLVAAALFEFGIRWFEPQAASPYHFAPATYFELIPGAQFEYQREEFSVPVSINAFGMRDRPRRKEKPAGGLRVALLGDSFAEALQVPLDSTVARLLEERLQSCFPARSVEVLNFGVSGFGVAACAARARHLALDFHPDLVLYLFVANDLADIFTNDARLYVIEGDSMRLRPVELGPARRQLRRLTDFAKTHLHAYRFIRFRLLQRSADQQFAVALERGQAAGTAEPLHEETAWLRFRQGLAILQQEAAAAGAPLLLAQATTDGPQMTARLAQLCAELGVPRIDLAALLDADPGPVTFRIDHHWQPRGHRLAAETLAPVVCDMLGGKGTASRTGP